jgi:hypothetical protein
LANNCTSSNTAQIQKILHKKVLKAQWSLLSAKQEQQNTEFPNSFKKVNDQPSNSKVKYSPQPTPPLRVPKQIVLVNCSITWKTIPSQ